MPSRHLRVVSVAAAMIMFAVTGCGSGSTTATFTSTFADITVAVVPSVNNTSVYIAQYEGFFAQQGLHVTIRSIPSSQVVIKDQLSGKIDICAGAYLPYFIQQAKGKKFHILAEGSVMGQATRVLLTPPDSHITTLSQLAGQKIGLEATNSIGTLLVSATLQQNGVPPSDVHFVTNPDGFKTMAKQLATGKWAAAFFGEPFATQAEEKYGDVVLASLDQGSIRGLPITGFMATQTWTDQHPAAAAAFVRAIEQAQQVAATEPNVLRAAIEKSDNLPGVVTDVMSLPGFPIGPVNSTRLQTEILDMLQFGQLGQQYAAEAQDGSLIRSMISPGS